MAVFWECGLGLKKCSETHPCPMHDKFKVAREAMRRAIHKLPLKARIIKREEGDA